MSYHKFDEDEVIFNTIKSHPESSFYMFQTSAQKIRLIYNAQKNPVVDTKIKATYDVDPNDPYPAPNINHLPYGFLELYGNNVSRPFNNFSEEPDFIYPFITKDSGLASMSSVSTSSFNSDFSYGDIIRGRGTRGATISAQNVPSGTTSLAVNGRLRDALRTTFKHYVTHSRRFSYETGLEGLDASSSSWEEESFKLIQIPSIFYGEKLKKGTVKLDWYNLGKLVGTVEDSRQNGELIVTHSMNPEEIGKFVGLVFYSEGFIILTQKSDIYSSDIAADQRQDVDGAVTWKNFMEPLRTYRMSSNSRQLCDQADNPGLGSTNEDGSLAPDNYPDWPATDGAKGTSIVESSFVVQVPMGTNATPGAHVVVSSFSPEIEDIRLTLDEAAVEKYRLNRITALQSGSVFKLEAYSNGGYAVASAAAIANFTSLYPFGAMVLQDKNSDYSYNLYFKGQHTIPTLLMLANIEKSEGSHSNNSTFLDSDYEFVGVKLSQQDGLFIPILQENGILVAELEEDQGLSPVSGEFFPLEIEGIVDSNGSAIFDNKVLVVETTNDSKKLKIHRILENGERVPMTSPGSTVEHNGAQVTGLMPVLGTRFKVQKNCYQKNKPFAGSFGYVESSNFKIKNTVKSKYNDPYAEYEDHTYISKIGLYDEDRNLIGIAKLATPVKKTPTRDFTFKLKIDL